MERDPELRRFESQQCAQSRGTQDFALYGSPTLCFLDESRRRSACPRYFRSWISPTLTILADVRNFL
jgi:hypothetical protein